MPQNRKFIPAAVVILVMLFITACRPTSETPDVPGPPTATDEPDVPATQAPTATATGTVTPTQAPTATLTPEPTSTPFVTGPDSFPAGINPLTGLEVRDPSLLERHPVLVKISNFPRGLRPHTGLSWADLVFEYYIGAGATRFTALFYGQNPPAAGPVRSARMIDAQLGNHYNALLAFASADSFVYSRILSALGDRAITEGPNSCPHICRIGSGDVNSVRAYPELITDFAESERDIPPVRQNLNGNLFDPAAPEGGSSGLVATVNYSISTISEWRFDDASGLYKRYIEAVDANGAVSVVPLVDALTDEQLTAANVVVLFVETIEMKPTLHDFELAGNYAGQRGLLFRDGQVYEITWRSQGANLPLQLLDANGEPIALRPGNTWFHVVGLNSSTEEVSPGSWNVTNFIP